MTVTPGFTAEEIAGFVRAYLSVPYGSKGAWLREQPFSRDQMYRWREAYLSGDLERGLVPRERSSKEGWPSGLVRAKAAEEELVRVQEKARKDMAALRRDHELEMAKKDAQITMLEEGTKTLGKAIGLLQNLSLQGPKSEGIGPDVNGSGS